jgi:formamidopyrimidine-DNA glycosylase
MVGRTFARVRTNAPPTSIVVSPSLRKRKLETLLPGSTVKSIERRGKNILIKLDNDSTLWVHLKMTGKFRQTEPSEPREKHDLVTFDFASNGRPHSAQQLRFNDYRRFGRLRLFPDHELWQQPGLVDLGPEPLEITAEEFVALCQRRPRMIKPALMDQSFIAGIGNIYADESLFASRIHPTRLSASLSRKKLVELHGHIQRLLQWSIDMMGTTVISYVNVNGGSGSFQNCLSVYGHEGEPCRNCGGTIVREKLGSRSAHFCPRCQRRR